MPVLILTMGMLFRRLLQPIRIAALLLLGSFLFACQPDAMVDEDPPASFTLGVLPNMQADEFQQRYQPMLDYLSDELGTKVELRITESYSDLMRCFERGLVDLAFFGGVTFLKAQEEFGAIPLVSRELDTRFTTYILVNKSLDARTINDLAGESFAFVSPQSTSGHIMPRYFLEQEGIVPEKFFGSVDYSGSHPTSIDWVQSGKVMAVVAHSSLVDSMRQSGELEEANFRILWESHPFPNSVWGLQPKFSEAFQNRLRNAFMALTTNNPEHREILSPTGTDYYVPVMEAAYSDLRRAVRTYESNGLIAQ